MKPASLPAPLRLALILATSIFVVEWVVMEQFVDVYMPNAANWIAALADASLLVVLLSPVIFLTVLRPLTRELEAHERFEKEQERVHTRLAMAVEGGRLALWEADFASGKVWLSEAWAGFLGNPRFETWTTTGDLIALAHPDDRQRLLSVTTAVVKGERPQYSEEHRVRAASGEWRWMLSKGRVIERAADGRALRASGTVFDITERKLAEEEIKESEERFRALIEFAPQSIILTDPDGRIVLVNAQAETTFGYPREELIGRTIEMLVPERYRPQHPGLRTDYLAAPTPRTMGAGRELFGLRKDGTEVPVEIGLCPVQIRGRSYALASVVDITERKQAQEAIERANRIRGEFMANVTHELRTPLNSVIGFAELLKDEVPGPLNAKQAAFAADILAGGQHLLALVEGVLEMSRLDAGAAGSKIETVDIGAMLEERVAAQRKAAEPRGVTIKLEVAADAGSAQLDPGALRRMLDALLDNAIKFNREDGTVTVRARRRLDAQGLGGALEIAVADTGIGIAREDLGRLFRPFSQLDSGLARRHGGVGLGLALARGLVELHGGTIDVQSEPGKGSTFTLRLPIGRQP